MIECNIFRDGTVHIKREMCGTCVFRPGNLMRMRPGALKEVIQGNLDLDVALPCHETTHGQNENKAVCRGFFDRYKRDSGALRLAVGMGVIEEDE